MERRGDVRSDGRCVLTSAARSTTPTITPEEPDDAVALERLARGEMHALSAIYERHHTAVRRFVSRVTQGAGDVDDIVHDTFLAVPGAAKRYDGRPNCRSWLLGIAARVLSRRSRSLGRFGRMILRFGDELRARAPFGPTVEQAENRSDDVAAVQAALARLSEAKRIVLLMAEAEEMPCEEIAKLLEIPVGTVWTRLHHARRELRGMLKNEVTR